MTFSKSYKMNVIAPNPKGMTVKWMAVSDSTDIPCS